jgi:hypothetical protein
LIILRFLEFLLQIATFYQHNKNDRLLSKKDYIY